MSHYLKQIFQRTPLKILAFFLIISSISYAQENEQINNANQQVQEAPPFKEFFSKLEEKELPIVNSANFDDFIGEQDFKKIDALVLDLHKIYPHWFESENKYRIVSAFRLNISDLFYSTLVTISKNDYEMETFLINHSMEDHYIDAFMTFSGNIADKWTQRKSRIEKGRIVVSYLECVNEDDRPVEVDTDYFRIDNNGKIERMSIEEDLIFLARKQLDLSPDKAPFEAVKRLPNNSNEAIVFFAETIKNADDNLMFELNSHIAIMNVETKEITHKYFESHKTTGWTSDAIQVENFTIDTAHYQVAEDTRAFGILLYAANRSRGNPYQHKLLSLYVKKEDEIQKILNNLMIIRKSAEYTYDCEGEFFNEDKVLIMSNKKSNGYFDISLKTKLTEGTHFGDCETKEKTANKSSVLKFNGEEYIEF